MNKTKLFIGTVLLVTAAVLFAQESTETTAASATETATEGISNAVIVAELKDAAASDVSLSVFATAVENSPVDSALIKDGITVLAFDSGASDATAVENIGDYIVVGKITKDDLFTKSSLQTLSGKELPVQIINDKFVVVDRAIRDEGTSYKYLPADTYVTPDLPLTELVYTSLKDLNCPCIKGTTWTTDAFYRETNELIKKRKEQGAVCVEMECASWCAVAKKKGLRFAQILYFSDVVNEEDWKRNIQDDEYYGNNYDLMLELILKVFDEMKKINNK